MQQTGNAYSLYFHIPFCSRKCDYCHFFVVPNQQRYHAPFLAALKREVTSSRSKLPSTPPESIYFGGGTPSCLSGEEIKEILSWLSPPPSTEITLEANPDQLTKEKLQAYKNAGINRLSIGVQSFDETLLKRLSRTHCAKQAKTIITLASEVGFDNLSIDLMYDLPSQSLKQWEETLHQATALPISHLSLYNLTVEPHTPFFKKKATLTFPTPEESLDMLEMAVAHFEQAGLKRYEISAFGRPSRHNLGYWTNRPFLGYGPSAFSYWEGARFRNVANFWRYIKQIERGESPMDFSEKLPPTSHEKERVAVGLRVLDGVKTNLDLSQLVKEGFLKQDSLNYSLTEKGLLFYDSVASEIIE